MKRLIPIVLILSFLAACEGSTKYGDCIGVQDTPDPAYVYKTPTRNIVWTVIGSYTVVFPLIFFFSDFRCPVERRVTPTPQ